MAVQRWMIDLPRKAEVHWSVQTHDPFSRCLCQSLNISSSVIDSRPSGTAQFITLFRVSPQSKMASQFIRAMLVLLLMAPINIVAHLHLRQTALNQTATPTANPSQANSIATPPPCCWIVVGTHAVGYNNWYSTTAEQTVGRRRSPIPFVSES
jgi:hypothetical protein